MSKEVAVLGVGMHPWGKWGKSFVEYGVKATRDALADAGIEWKDIQFVSGGDTIRNGYPGYVAGATFCQALGWNGAQVASSYGACASGTQAINNARAQILAGLCDVALVVGADAAPKGFFAPTGRRPSGRSRLAALSPDRRHQPDLLRSLGAPAHGDLRRHRTATSPRSRSRTRATASAIPNARYRKEVTKEEVLGSAIVSDPLRLLEICATSDGGAAIVLSSMEFARKAHDESGEDRRRIDRDAGVPEHGDRDAELLHRLRRRRSQPRRSRSAIRSLPRPTRRPGSAPRT